MLWWKYFLSNYLKYECLLLHESSSKYFKQILHFDNWLRLLYSPKCLWNKLRNIKNIRKKLSHCTAYPAITSITRIRKFFLMKNFFETKKKNRPHILPFRKKKIVGQTFCLDWEQISEKWANNSRWTINNLSIILFNYCLFIYTSV